MVQTNIKQNVSFIFFNEHSGCSRASWGFHRWGVPCISWVGFLMELVKQLVGSMSLQCPLNVLSATLSASCLSPVMLLTTQYSAWGETGMALLGAGFSFLCTHFSPQKESQARKFSIGMELCHFGGGMTKVKSNCSSYSLSNASKLVIFVGMLCWNFTDNLDFHKGSLTHRCLSKKCTLELFRLKPREAGTSSQVPAESTVHRQDQGRCAYYYPTHRGVRLLPGSWYVVLGPIAPTQALWSLDAKLLLLRGDTMRDMWFCHVADIILEIYLTHTDSSLFEKCTLFPVCCQLSPLNHYHPHAFPDLFSFSLNAEFVSLDYSNPYKR